MVTQCSVPQQALALSLAPSSWAASWSLGRPHVPHEGAHAAAACAYATGLDEARATPIPCRKSNCHLENSSNRPAASTPQAARRSDERRAHPISARLEARRGRDSGVIRSQAHQVRLHSNVLYFEVRAPVALLPPAALAAQDIDSLGARPIPLREAVVLAEENGLAAIQSRGQIRNAQSAVRSAKGALLPSLSISLNQTNTSGDQLDPITGVVTARRATKPWNYSTGLNSSVNLFDGGRRLNEVKRARFDVSAAEANEVNQKFNIALQ